MQFKIIWLLTGRWLDSIIISCALSASESTLGLGIFYCKVQVIRKPWGRGVKDKTIEKKKGIRIYE